MPFPSDQLKVSTLRYPVPLWRYLLLFQSWTQLQSWLMLVLTTILLIVFVINLLKPSSVPDAAMLVGATLGSLCSVVMVFPVEFDVFSSSEQTMALLERQVTYMGYVRLSCDANTTLYRQKLPRLLRWDEGNIKIYKQETKVTVRGGWVALKNIRRLY